MLRVCVDPYTLACPSSSEGMEVFLDYVGSLLELQELNASRRLPVVGSVGAAEILSKTSKYPIWTDLKDIISRYGINDIQPRDIVRIVNTLLTQLLFIEDDSRIRDLLYEGEFCEPFSSISHRRQEYQIEFYRLAVWSHLEDVLCGNKYVLYTRDIPNGVETIRFAATIQHLEHKSGDYVGGLPLQISDRLPFCSNRVPLRKVFGSEIIWVNVDNKAGKMFALKCALEERMVVKGRDAAEAESFLWKAGPQFFKSLETLGFAEDINKARNLLQACVDTIVGDNLRATHALRIGDGAEDPQQFRGEDGAWRRDISHEFHLHYWITPSGPEFASVVMHRDMSIPQ